MLAMADWARRTARTWGVSRASEPLAADIQGRTNHDAVHSDRPRIHVRIRRVFSLARRVVERRRSVAGWGGGNPECWSAHSHRSENANRPVWRCRLKPLRTSCTDYPNGMRIGL